LHRLLAPVFAPALHLAGGGHHFAFWPDVVIMVISLALAVVGWWYAYRFYVREPQLPQQWAARWQEYYTLLVNKYYVDEAYLRGIVWPMHRFALALWQAFDVRVIDRIVNGVAGFVRLDGEFLRHLQTGYVRTYALWIVIGALVIFWSLY
jgi:NADH-quinone oxidoreductase subunit L